MSDTDVIRDRAARADQAAAIRAQGFASLASSCESCATALSTFSTQAEGRADSLGGVWQPWGTQVPDNAKNVPDIADAPLSIDEFIAWNETTALRDLATASNPDALDGGQAVVLAQVALSRYADTQGLALTYGIGTSTQSQSLQTLNSRFSLKADNRELEALATWGIDQEHLENGTLLPTLEVSDETGEKLAASTELSDSVARWDCVAQSLPTAQLKNHVISDASIKADELFSRVDKTLKNGATDTRAMRCSIDTSSADAIFLTLIEADLHLVNTSDEGLRTIGIQAALDDIRSWMGVATMSSLPLPTPVPAKGTDDSQSSQSVARTESGQSN